ncbi:alpha/beta fold hydrolase [Microcella alkaliphila]|uniref:Hydrolase, alpha/beta hydrolase fold family n=1 Tax=Microcella alkaliphila TaxID=279828 RepID=A0A0U4WVJ4_9MICO|nr:alpha/beta hydrolase [Microcella alkaliphila]BAU31816.1 hydrolase, alpha/beta hydrolase fold family [Microcella alkaliphila]
MITSLAGGRVLAEKHGSTPPRVVALHGWGRDGTDFETVLSGLDAVSIHLPGFGPAPAPESAWGTGQYAELVADAIAAYAPVVLVGHSFGGRVAVRLAAARPELVSGLVLTGVPLVRLTAPTPPPTSYRLARWANRRGIISDRRMEAIRRRRGSSDYRAAQGVMRDILVRVVGETYDDALGTLRCPVRMVWGQNDTDAPTDAGRVASERIGGSRFRVVDGTAHLMTGDLELAVREELLTLLDELDHPE